MQRLRKVKLSPKVKIAIFVAVIIIAILLALVAIDQHERRQLREIGFSNSAIERIDNLNLRRTLIERGEFSFSLQFALTTDNVHPDFLELYFIVGPDGNNIIVNQQAILLYRRLLDRNYKSLDIHTLFSYLNFREITPLLVFDFQEDLAIYIEDVINNRARNINQFVLSNSYRVNYETVFETNINSGVLMLVNKTHHLPENFLVDDLVMISHSCRMNEMFLQSDAAAAYELMCLSMREVGLRPASVSAHRSREVQQQLLDNAIASFGEVRASERVARPRFSEHETGLAVDIASLTSFGVPFYQSLESAWLLENAHRYGFILRYPRGFEQITGVMFEAWHYRYVGVEMATIIFESGFTFDEFYLLFLAEFRNVE